MRYAEMPIIVPGQPSPARLVSYVPDAPPEIYPGRRRPAVVVCPGGGYQNVSAREAEPIALRLMALGLNAFVLHYHVAPSRFPVAQLELARAVAIVRENADAWHTDPDHIIVMGFSAGGHLAASLGVLWHGDLLAPALDVSREAIQPNGMILAYPVITSGPHRHAGSFLCLLGEWHDELLDTVSLEKLVTAKTPPAFIWHTFEDPAVPVENSLLLACALREAGVNTELHIFPRGSHGLSLSNDQVYGPHNMANMRPECACWIDMAARWAHALN